MVPEIPVFTVASGGGLPSPPSRAQLLGSICRFQGVFTQTQQYGLMPSGFTPAIAWLAQKADRLACYADLRAAGSQKLVFASSGQYHNPNDSSNWFNRMPGRDFVAEGAMGEFHDLIVEAVADGGMTGVEVWCGGDGVAYDPNGFTHGYDWLMANFAGSIFAPLADLNEFLVWYAGSDGYAVGWNPDNSDKWKRNETWATFARSVIGPTGHLGAYMPSGFWCWTEENRWLSPGGREYDKVAYEFPAPMGPPTSPVPSDFCNQKNEVRAPFDEVWQTSNRALGPRYRRPPEQPACDDNKTFPEQIPPNVRGEVFRDGREYDTYHDARFHNPPTDQRRAYLVSLGWPLVG